MKKPRFNICESGCLLPPHHASVLEYLARKHGHDQAVFGELGTWTGRSASILAPHCGTLYAIDWFQGTPGECLEAAAAKHHVLKIFKSNMEILGIDNVEVIPLESAEAAKRFPAPMFDLFYIDADHHYEQVKLDIETWGSLVKSGGILCGHDFDPGHPGVVSAVTDVFNAHDLHIRSSIWWTEVK